MSGGAIGRSRFTRRAGRLATFLRSPSHLWLAARMSAWAALLAVLKRAVPLSRLVRFVRARPVRTARPDTVGSIAQLDQWIYWRRREGRCLERSLLVYRYLGIAGARPTLVSGLRRCDDEWKGHAWVVVDGAVFNEPEAAVEQYAPIVTFDSNGHMVTADRPAGDGDGT